MFKVIVTTKIFHKILCFSFLFYFFYMLCNKPSAKFLVMYVYFFFKLYMGPFRILRLHDGDGNGNRVSKVFQIRDILIQQKDVKSHRNRENCFFFFLVIKQIFCWWMFSFDITSLTCKRDAAIISVFGGICYIMTWTKSVHKTFIHKYFSVEFLRF